MILILQSPWITIPNINNLAIILAIILLMAKTEATGKDDQRRNSFVLDTWAYASG